ncbi:MAG: hypothetical protein ACRD0N_04950 [Acidimicrobiales bacterium]
MAIVLACASVASACVQMIGRLEVTGTNGGTSVAIGNGTHPPFNMYCVPPTNGATAPRTTNFRDRPLVNIAYGPASECNPIPDLGGTTVIPGRANTPGDGTYEVNYCDGKVFQQKNGEWGFRVYPLDAGSCFFSDSPVDRGVLMGTMTVAGGSGSASLRIPAFAATNGPKNAAGIAVRRTGPGRNPAGGPPDVNLVPISII